ncbi:hypothetical protein F4604DRAFT_1753799 [Suillus subluteus]|nr:hypothetical protein F4604DRAFT_1753799 [Suillus subluteus]
MLIVEFTSSALGFGCWSTSQALIFFRIYFKGVASGFGVATVPLLKFKLSDSSDHNGKSVPSTINLLGSLVYW